MEDKLRLNTKLYGFDGIIGRRDYFLNGKAIILDKYQDVENAKNDQDMDAVNSMGSGVYQSSVGRNFNQTDNQFQESNRFDNQPKIPISSNTNNYINQSGELNTLYSPNSNNLNSPTQMFDTNNNNTFTKKSPLSAFLDTPDTP